MNESSKQESNYNPLLVVTNVKKKSMYVRACVQLLSSTLYWPHASAEQYAAIEHCVSL